MLEGFPDVPPRTEYSLTDFGKTLLPHVEVLIKWGQENFNQIMINRQKNITNIPEQFFTVTIKKIPDENFGIGGKSIGVIKRNYDGQE